MDPFEGRVAIVTGGACGMGRALCEALSQRGAAMVVVADIHAEGAQQVASGLATAGGRAHAATVDVSQAEAVQQLVADTVSTQGRLDYMFNNAGITIGGEARDMGLEHWERTLDVNLWGVIYGTISAYKVMVEQGFGHIVNTSSVGGLVPVPMGTAYAAAKHAVVGLSTSLRAEGAGLGVKVSVVCPGFVETGVAESAIMVTPMRDEEAMFGLAPARMMSAQDSARVILRGVARNQAIIPVTALARISWWLYRLHPGILNALFRKRIVDSFRALRSEP
jgi:NAD(P)-dependent dehydrogenase (short-subunit alcohol dehydrogenase family)